MTWNTYFFGSSFTLCYVLLLLIIPKIIKKLLKLFSQSKETIYNLIFYFFIFLKFSLIVVEVELTI